MNKNRAILIFSLIIIIANILVYSKASNYWFLDYDDDVRITENMTLKKLNKENMKAIFFAFQQANYQPLIFFTHAIQYKLFELDPKPYHIINIILHVINSLLVLLLIYYLSKSAPIAFIVALFFSLHPVQVESVAWITEIKGLMCTLFYLLSFIAYIHSSGDKKRRNYALCFIFFIIALLCKPIAITLPVVFIIYDYCYKEKFSMSMIKEKTPLILITLFFSVIFYFAQKSGAAVKMQRIEFFLTNTLFGFYNIGFYIIKLIFPKDLSVHYAYIYEMTLFSGEFFLSFSVIVALVCYIKYFKRIKREVHFGILFFIVNLLPILRFIPIGDTMAADRYLYMPIIGFFFAVTTAVYPYVVSKKNLKRAVSVIVALYIGYLTYFTSNQLNTWQNSFTLWTNVLKSNNDHFNAYIGIGNHYLNVNNDFENAKKYFLKAANHKLAVSQEMGLYNLGFTCVRSGERQKAKEYFDKLITIFPDNRMGNNESAYLFLSVISINNKQNKEAERYFKDGTSRYPRNADLHMTYAILLENLNRTEEAAHHYELAIQSGQESNIPQKALKRLQSQK